MTHLGFPLREASEFTAISAPQSMLESAPRPLVLVLEPEPLLSDLLVELSSFLRVEVECVPTIGALETALQTQDPIGLLAHSPEADSRAWQALRAVARNAPGLPVLLITGGREAEAEDLDPAQQRRPLTNVYWVDQRPGLRSIAEFLFLAERRCNVGPALRPDSD